MSENNNIIKRYLKEISTLKDSGEAREETYYSKLETLLNRITESYGKKDIEVYPQPGNAEYKNPDFKVKSGNRIVGYIEAKKPGEDLIKLESSDQVKGYLKAYKNLITTDFYNFRLYRNGVFIKKVTLENIKQTEDFDALSELINTFFGFSMPEKYTAEMLAKDLANRTKLLKKQVEAEMNKENEEIIGLYEDFKNFLMADLTTEKFADIFSQTVTYGLFISRTRTKDVENFNRETAFRYIPSGIGVLKKIFTHILTNEDIIDKDMGWMVDDIADILKQTDVNTILKEHHDPIIHFYETFLEEYDPEIRKSQGVYYTPDPVVSYITNSLNFILKSRFDKTTGFADDSVTLLDPASGTMTFMSKAIEIAEEENPHKGAINELIKDHIIKNFYAFEVMMTPYIIGHFRMMLSLEEMGYKMNENDKFNLYLTNTLAITDPPVSQFFSTAGRAMLKELKIANEVKKKTEVLAIFGNPPYSVSSKNNDPFILKLIEDYKVINGEKIKEKQTNAIQDDYVKFIRFAQHKIDENGEGVIGFITNHGFIDNVTFRAMRYSLMESFNEIYILDLHGNAALKEVHPDGSKDENVFNIMRGVSISFFIKRKGVEGTKVYHSDLWGTQEYKYEKLLNNGFENTEWKELTPNSPNYFFTPQNEEYRDQYELGWKVTDIFPLNGSGITTARDKLTIQFTKDKMWEVVQDFSSLPEEETRAKYNLGKDARDWKVKSAQEGLIETGPSEDMITKILYRPFDERYTYYINKSKSFLKTPAPRIMSHMMKENLGLSMNRLTKDDIKHPFISSEMIDLHLLGSDAYLFPLYLHGKDGSVNINNIFTKLLSSHYSTEPSPENILYYIYAVLYSETYRNKYANFLKIDFPRIPFTTSQEVFLKISSLGEQIANLHLMEPSVFNELPTSTLNVIGDSIIEKVKRQGNDVYINKTQHFNGITDEVWEYEIGGYKVLDKWLKSHKGRKLDLGDINHFSKIVTALSKTIELQVDIDKLYPEIEKSIIEYDEKIIEDDEEDKNKLSNYFSINS